MKSIKFASQILKEEIILKTVAVIGSGSWGVALAIHLAKKGNRVNIWSFDQTEADLILTRGKFTRKYILLHKL